MSLGDHIINNIVLGAPKWNATNANLSGAVQSVGNVTTTPVISTIDASTTVCSNSLNPNFVNGSQLTSTYAGNALVRSNLQVQMRPGLMAAQATADLNTLYAYLTGLAATASTSAAMTSASGPIVPGVYDFASAISVTGTVTLTGTATSVWVFRTAAAFGTPAGNSTITMAGGALACNVFWVIGNNAPSFGATTTFRGTMLNTAAIALAATMVMEGRVLSKAGAITVGAGTTMSIPTGISTVPNLGVLSTFLAYTTAGACATTSAIPAIGDVGSGDTAPATWATNGLSGNVYAPTTLASRISFGLYKNGVLVAGSYRAKETLNSALTDIALETTTALAVSDTVDCRVNAMVGSAVVTSKFTSAIRLS